MFPNSLSALAPDVSRIQNFVADELRSRGVPECSDSPHFVADLTGELITKVPQILGEVSLASAAGDDDAARASVTVALAALEAVAPNALYGPADSYKRAYRAVLRRLWPNDHAMGDSQVFRDDLTTSRRQLRIICDQRGWLARDFEVEGEKLRQADIAKREHDEQTRAAKDLESIRRKEAEAISMPFSKQQRRRLL